MAVAKSKTVVDENLPSPEEAGRVMLPALAENLQRCRESLISLSHEPPQVLHLEGGLVHDRFALALWWAALLNCEQAADERPCLQCPVCLRIGANMFADVILLDGRESSLKIDDMRALQPLMGEKPHFGRKRVVILLEAQALGGPAANSLLKILEEPNAGTVFVFTAPQRERLLPTLISRGWVLTLPWPDPSAPLPSEMEEWQQALAEFLRSGRGWFARSGVKGAIDPVRAQSIISLLQKALADVAANRAASPLATVLARLSPNGLLEADTLLGSCQEAIQLQVNPALALDAVLTRLSLLK